MKLLSITLIGALFALASISPALAQNEYLAITTDRVNAALAENASKDDILLAEGSLTALGWMVLYGNDEASFERAKKMNEIVFDAYNGTPHIHVHTEQQHYSEMINLRRFEGGAVTISSDYVDITRRRVEAAMAEGAGDDEFELAEGSLAALGWLTLYGNDAASLALADKLMNIAYNTWPSADGVYMQQSNMAYAEMINLGRFDIYDQQPDPGSEPGPARFTDQGDGTVLDNEIGLVWLQNPSALTPRNWADATAFAASLEEGGSQPALTDDSRAGEWRLPTNEEWKMMVPSGRQDASAGVFSVDWEQRYWSSTAPANEDGAYHLGLWGDGGIDFDSRRAPRHIWPVRSPMNFIHGGDDEPNVSGHLAPMQGRWQSVDEPARVIEIWGDLLSAWQNEEHQGDATIAFMATCEGHEADPEARYFTMTQGSDAQCFFLNKAEEAALELFSVVDGITYRYEKSPATHGGDAPDGSGHLNQMQGQWQSVDDVTMSVEVQGDLLSVWNDGEHGGGGTIAFVKSCQGHEADPEARYFTVTSESSTECFFLNKVEQAALELFDVTEGTTHSFTRIR